MRNLKIGARLVLLVVVQVVALAAIGAMGVISLNRSSEALEQSARVAQDLEELVTISDIVRGDVVDTIYALNAGIVDWARGKAELDGARQALEAEF
ncbi:MAG: Tar ligand binding domain-containing protein, partial [Gammaproteobacteria bacterium]